MTPPRNGRCAAIGSWHEARRRRHEASRLQEPTAIPLADANDEARTCSSERSLRQNQRYSTVVSGIRPAPKQKAQGSRQDGQRLAEVPRDQLDLGTRASAHEVDVIVEQVDA